MGDRAAGAAIGEALAASIGLRQLVFVFPGAALDEIVDIGAIGAIRVAKDPQ